MGWASARRPGRPGRRICLLLVCVVAGVFVPSGARAAASSVTFVSDGARIEISESDGTREFVGDGRYASNFERFDASIASSKPGYVGTMEQHTVVSKAGNQVTQITSSGKSQAVPPDPDPHFDYLATTADSVLNVTVRITGTVFVSLEGTTSSSGRAVGYVEGHDSQHGSTFAECLSFGEGEFDINAFAISNAHFDEGTASASYSFTMTFHPVGTTASATPSSSTDSGDVCSERPTVSSQTISVSENAGTAIVSVALDHATLQTVKVVIFTAAGEAVPDGANPDYRSMSQTLTFEPGQVATSVEVDLVSDNAPEAEERFHTLLRNPQNAEIGDEGTVHILDDKCDIQAVVGSSGKGTADGTPAGEVICGTYAPDHLSGGGGDDTILGGFGGDVLIGDGGSDTMWADDFQSIEGCATSWDYVDELYGGFFDPSLVDDSTDRLRGGCGRNKLYGEDGDDSIIGGRQNFIEGGMGADDLNGGLLEDTIYGGWKGEPSNASDGDDHIWGYAGKDTIYGGNGSDTIRGGIDDDAVYGEGGADFIYGEDGDDSLYGGVGADLIEGGIGSDFIFGLDETGGTDAGNALGGDTYPATNADVLLAIVQADSTSTDIITGASGQDSIVGSNGEDFIYAEGGNDVIEGLRGDDHDFGGPGNDRINELHYLDSDTISGGDDTDDCTSDPLSDTENECETGIP